MNPMEMAEHIVGMYKPHELTSAIAWAIAFNIGWRDKRIQSLEDALASVESILWMAERYAEGGGFHGVEMHDLNRVKDILAQVKVK
jgi:hypothetical protein